VRRSAANLGTALLVISFELPAADLPQGARIELYRRVDRACSEGNLRALRMFAAAGIDLDPPDVKNFTHLASAAAAGRLETVRFLLDHGADPNRRGDMGPSPLCAAAQNRHADVVQLLLARGASCARPCYHETPGPPPRVAACPAVVPAALVRLEDLSGAPSWTNMGAAGGPVLQLYLLAGGGFELERHEARDGGGSTITRWRGKSESTLPMLHLRAEATGKLTYPQEAARKHFLWAMEPSTDSFDVRLVDGPELVLVFARTEYRLRRY
jgi:hypothetical protein